MKCNTLSMTICDFAAAIWLSFALKDIRLSLGLAPNYLKLNRNKFATLTTTVNFQFNPLYGFVKSSCFFTITLYD